MAGDLPLLVFPRARTVPPQTGHPFPPEKLIKPSRARQVERVRKQLTDLQEDFARYKATVSDTIAGLEPETVLVIETAGRIKDLRQALESTGLEWLGEWDVDDLEPDHGFYKPIRIGPDFFKNHLDSVKTRADSKRIQHLLLDQGYLDSDGDLAVHRDPRDLWLPDDLEHLKNEVVKVLEDAKKQPIQGRLFISMSNQSGLNELLKMWELWASGKGLPRGRTKFREVFSQLRTIRRWGIQEALGETGMINRWRDLRESGNLGEKVTCQIELFYRMNEERRKENEHAVSELLDRINGHIIGSFIDISEIGLHAVKASIPAERISHLLDLLETPNTEVDIQLFTFWGIMYFRPTGQTLVSHEVEDGVEAEFEEGVAEQSPIVAILDGVPNLQHAALRGRIVYDDPNNLAAEYQPGERRHGTSMASLVIHGDLGGQATPLRRQVYHAPIMQPDSTARPFGLIHEHVPEDEFLEDRIQRAVRRMFEGEGDVPAQAPDIKVINLSIGDPERPFIHTPSPLARLLDWLSFKYRVLFCVSAGNYDDGMDIGLSTSEFAVLSDEEKLFHVLRQINRQLSERRLYSPGESLNAITVGALHWDETGEDYDLRERVDLLPAGGVLFSPSSRVGYGFKRSIKPEILFPGGRQLYQKPSPSGYHIFTPSRLTIPPGQQVAWDSAQLGVRSAKAYTRGTSNATALATRAAAQIYDVLEELQASYGEQIPDHLVAVLIKTLLVHGARHGDHVKELLAAALETSSSPGRFRQVVARFMGYGAVNLERVLGCTQQRATVIGGGEIRQDEVHEYRFPLPLGLSGEKQWRRMVVTLAWFSPINPNHRNLREAKLEIKPGDSWGQTPLKVKRVDSDDSQVKRGTVQHEVLEADDQISGFAEGDQLLLHVTCRPDATQKLDEPIPYGLAVTLEVAEGIDIPIYDQVRAGIRPQVAVEA